MRYAIPMMLAGLLLAPLLWGQAQGVTRAWGEQVLVDSGGRPSAYDLGDWVAGYEFEVLAGGVVPEVVELGCALSVQTDRASLEAYLQQNNPGWTVTGGTTQVALWELTSPTSGVRIALEDVEVVKTDRNSAPAQSNWAWADLSQPIVLTPGTRYRVVVRSGITLQLWDDSSTYVGDVTDYHMYFAHHTSNPPLAQPSGPIQYITPAYDDGQTWPATGSIDNLPRGSANGSAHPPWGMADIGWREVPVSPVLANPVSADDSPGVLISEIGPDVTTAGHEGGEIQNVCDRWQDVSGWRICIWDSSEAGSLNQSKYDPVAIGTIPQGTSLAPGQVYTFGESVAAGSFDLAFGAWGWSSTSQSAVALLDASDNVIDVVRVNALNLSQISNPVSGLQNHWPGTYLGNWNTTNTWQRQGNTNTRSISDWTRGNAQSVGTPNSVLTTPFPGAGERYSRINGPAPGYTGRLEVGDGLQVTFAGSDPNSGDTLTLTVTWTGGLTPAQAGFTGIGTTQPATANGGNSVSITLNGTAQTAGTISLEVEVSDSTNRTDIITYTLTIDPQPNFTPRIIASYDVGNGRQQITSPANFGTPSNPIPFGLALSAYAFEFTLEDGNLDSVGVTASFQHPQASQIGFSAADFEHAPATAPFNWSPNGQALFTHNNGVNTGITLTLSGDDGNGGTTQFEIHFLVGGQPQNAAPSLTVTESGNTVGSNGTIMVSPGAPLSSLNLQFTVNDADQDPVALTATISNLTTQGIQVSEFESGGFLPVSYDINPSSGVFSVPSVTHRVDLTADDGNWAGITDFSFFIVVNLAPTLSVSSNGAPLVSGATLNVDYLDTLASLGLLISVDDPDGDPTAVGAGVSGVTTQGFGAGNFSAAQQSVSYTITPTGGDFNDPAGSTHDVTLTATDTRGYQSTFDFTIVANPFQPQLNVSEVGGPSIANGAPAADGRDFGTRHIALGATAPLGVEVGNTGSGPLDLGAVSLSGPNASDFVLSAPGLPTQVFPGAPFTFDVAFNPALGGFKQATVTLQVDVAGTPVTFTFEVEGTGYDPNGVVVAPQNLPSVVNGQPFGPIQLAASGGTPGYDWSVLSGSLPYGISLTAQGLLSGTPQPNPTTGVFAGMYTFMVRATDSLGGTGEQAMSIEVLPPAMPGSAGGAGCAETTGAGTGALAVLLGLLAGFAATARRRAVRVPHRALRYSKDDAA